MRDLNGARVTMGVGAGTGKVGGAGIEVYSGLARDPMSISSRDIVFVVQVEWGDSSVGEFGGWKR
jgi:hypothetical protein